MRLVIILRVLKEAMILTKHLQEEKVHYTSTAVELVRTVRFCSMNLTEVDRFNETWCDILDL